MGDYKSVATSTGPWAGSMHLQGVTLQEDERVAFLPLRSTYCADDLCFLFSVGRRGLAWGWGLVSRISSCLLPRQPCLCTTFWASPCLFCWCRFSHSASWPSLHIAPFPRGLTGTCCANRVAGAVLYSTSHLHTQVCRTEQVTRAGAGEMIQWLSVLAALIEDQSSFPSTCLRWLTTTYNATYRRYSTLLWSLIFR